MSSETSMQICADCKGYDTLKENYCTSCNRSVETIEVFPRVCERDECGKGMGTGYLIGDSWVICSIECEIADCEKSGNCLCHDIHIPNLDLTQLILETKENKKFINDLVKSADEFGGIELNAKDWHKFLDTKTGEKNFAGGTDEWFWTEWYCDDLSAGETAYTLEGEAVELT